MDSKNLAEVLWALHELMTKVNGKEAKECLTHIIEFIEDHLYEEENSND
jgi:hypothetical protein